MKHRKGWLVLAVVLPILLAVGIYGAAPDADSTVLDRDYIEKNNTEAHGEIQVVDGRFPGSKTNKNEIKKTIKDWKDTVKERRAQSTSSVKDDSVEERWYVIEETLDDMLYEQEKDLEWRARTMEEAAKILREGRFAGTRLFDIECGESLCKMVLEHDDEESQKYIAESDFAHKGSWDGDQFGRNLMLENGTLGTYIYFTRLDDYGPFVEMKERLAMKGL